jgi:hypothetical protein
MSRPANGSIPHIVHLIQPRTTNAGFTTDVVSLKDALWCELVFHLTQAAAHATLITPRQATTVALGATAVMPVMPIKANEDVATSDTLAAKTAAANYTVTADIKHKIVVFDIDPAALTDGYPCVYATVSNSAEATNFCAAQAMIWTKSTPPASAIID